MLDIELTPVVGEPKLLAIEVERAGQPW